LQWVQDPREINGDNLNIIRRETSRHFINKKREYLKDKIDEFATSTKSKNIRDLYIRMNEFMRGYQPRSNLVMDENGDLLADCHNILNRWKNCFSQLLNIHSVGDVGQIEIHKESIYIFSVGFDVTDQLQIRYFAFVRYWRKNGSIMK
jgi:hypothetical protein